MEIDVIRGDITKIEADAIVNAANKNLSGGGGVDGAIHQAGGPEIIKECREIIQQHGILKTGEAVATTAGKLKAKIVIHTPGPIWNGGGNGEVEKLSLCYANSLKLAADMGMKTITFPNISTGIYGFPKGKAAETAVKTVKQSTELIDKVIFVAFDEENFKLYKQLLHLK